MEIRVYKSEKLLEAWVENYIFQTFPIGIGKVEAGHKLCEGDLKTPEGHYLICVKNPRSKFHLSLGLNYPNVNDAKMALQEGRIDINTYDQICQAHKDKKRPPWNTILGGQIYIHGDLESKTWSEGCVRMYKSDIEFLYERASIGTSVHIHP